GAATRIEQRHARPLERVASGVLADGSDQSRFPDEDLRVHDVGRAKVSHRHHVGDRAALVHRGLQLCHRDRDTHAGPLWSTATERVIRASSYGPETVRAGLGDQPWWPIRGTARVHPGARSGSSTWRDHSPSWVWRWTCTSVSPGVNTPRCRVE